MNIRQFWDSICVWWYGYEKFRGHIFHLPRVIFCPCHSATHSLQGFRQVAFLQKMFILSHNSLSASHVRWSKNSNSWSKILLFMCFIVKLACSLRQISRSSSQGMSPPCLLGGGQWSTSWMESWVKVHLTMTKVVWVKIHLTMPRVVPPEVQNGTPCWEKALDKALQWGNEAMRWEVALKNES